MTLPNTKEIYSRFLKAHAGKLHFAAHSHHFWPDVSRDAHLQYWDDCASFSDEKWGKIFEEVIPQTQKHIARLLHLKDHNQIVLAPNTHELTSRLLSLFLGKPRLRILTTTSEFHSWRRQFLRLTELSEVEVEQVSTAELLTKKRAVIEELQNKLKEKYDLFFISQVFFDSGIAFTDEELKELSDATPAETIMAIDGYHGFAALPTNLSLLEGKVFYLAGGYKYAQAGEGVGFMVIPKGEWRPAYTGWFAEYAELSRPYGCEVGYSQDAMAFFGATQDASGFYRFNAVWDLFQQRHFTLPKIHAHVRELQLSFLELLPPGFLDYWQLQPLFEASLEHHGHFLTFLAQDSDLAEKCQKALKESQILIDRRGNRLRFGFGLYQDLSDVAQLTERLQKWATKYQTN
jgi:selenocysteine lyase/cysteine desulfurase